MSTITPVAESAAAPSTQRQGRRGILFWIHRYLPAEIAGTAAMILAGIGVTVWTSAPPLVAIAAVIGESIGFYGVLAVTVYLEQSRTSAHGRRAVVRTALLLVAEFGPAEALDTLLVRPGALTLAVWLIPDPFLGLLAGKLVADVVFYVVAAGAFTVTDRAGLRDARTPEESAS